MALGKDSTRIRIAQADVFIKNNNGSPSTYKCLGYIEEAQIADEQEAIEIRDETGELIENTGIVEKFRLRAQLAQTGVDEVVLPDNYSNMSLSVLFVESGKAVDGLHGREYEFTDCRLLRGLDLPFQVEPRRRQIEFLVYNPDDATISDTFTFWDREDILLEDACIPLGLDT